MIPAFRERFRHQNLTTWLIVAVVLGLAFLLGRKGDLRWLGLLAGGLGALTLLAQPVIGLLAVILVALLLPLEISTGTDVRLNSTALLIPAMIVVWILDGVRRRHVRVVSSRVNLPLMLFLVAGLISLLIGRASWSPLVPSGGNFFLVQLAQWAIFAFSVSAFLLMANLVSNETVLWRLTAVFLAVAGGVAIARLLPGAGELVARFTTIAFIRASLWVLIVGLAGGQLFFNQALSLKWRIFLALVLLASLMYAFVQQQEATSNWVGIGAVMAVLIWFRFPRLRWPMLALVVILTAIGVLFPAVYQFAGGDEAWQNTGASRLVLIGRVIDVTMRNPITGLGPAAYRRYAAMEPLQYGRAFWVVPQVNSHNNYVDLFSHVGLVGLVLFVWFVAEIVRLGIRLHRRYQTGFAAGYVNGMLAASVGALVIMVFADWILPFVYNIGFPGFQASVLVWLFLGGLVALDSMSATRDWP